MSVIVPLIFGCFFLTEKKNELRAITKRMVVGYDGLAVKLFGKLFHRMYDGSLTYSMIQMFFSF